MFVQLVMVSPRSWTALQASKQSQTKPKRKNQSNLPSIQDIIIDIHWNTRLEYRSTCLYKPTRHPDTKHPAHATKHIQFAVHVARNTAYSNAPVQDGIAAFDARHALDSLLNTFQMLLVDGQCHEPNKCGLQHPTRQEVTGLAASDEPASWATAFVAQRVGADLDNRRVRHIRASAPQTCTALLV
jgi:hypothetical protein